MQELPSIKSRQVYVQGLADAAARHIGTPEVVSVG